ncbi:hypothetical protein ACOSQ3_017289 [Xanthoceras sorbifolium]
MYNAVRFIIRDSHQGNNKGNRKGKYVEKLYKVWTLEESNELLRLMVDAVIRGWCDSNGLLSKVTVERKIFPTLNGKLGCQKTFSHPTHRHYRTDTFANYKDLRIAIGNGTAVGRHSIALVDDTDARTFVVEERQGGGLEYLAFDTAVRAFIHNNQQENKPMSPGHPSSPLPSQPISSEIPPITKKQSRTEFEGPTRYSSVKTNNTRSNS